MSHLIHSTSDSLCKLVRWAHSHGTICNLIPDLQRHTHGFYGNVLTPEPGPQGGNVPVAVWGCGAGHAYHWPLSDHSDSRAGSVNASQCQERIGGGHQSSKVAVRTSCDLPFHEPASEGEEFSGRLFDITGCDSSATDEDGDYELQPCRKRSAAPGGAGSSGGVAGKKVKQEAPSAEEYDVADDLAFTELAETVSLAANTHSHLTHTPMPRKPLPSCQKPQRLGSHHEPHGQDLSCEGLVGSEMELLVGGSCITGTSDRAMRCSSAAETTEKTAGGHGELERLRVLLCAERNRNQQMTEMISNLRQDKEMLQQELTKKAELICDFLQDKLQLEKRRPHCSNQVEPSSHMASADDVTGFDSPTPLDSFEDHGTLKSKRSRDGENPRVRMKNVVGVIARYMAALQEFRRSVSMKVAFDRVGVDRNTISRTAAIAELSLAAPDVFHALAPWDEKEETLAHYAHRCRQAMNDNIKAKIKTMKMKGELLPIVSK